MKKSARLRGISFSALSQDAPLLRMRGVRAFLRKAAKGKTAEWKRHTVVRWLPDSDVVGLAHSMSIVTWSSGGRPRVHKEEWLERTRSRIASTSVGGESTAAGGLSSALRLILGARRREQPESSHLAANERTELLALLRRLFSVLSMSPHCRAVVLPQLLRTLGIHSCAWPLRGMCMIGSSRTQAK